MTAARGPNFRRRRHRGSPSRAAGFTIVEAVLSLVVATVAVAGALQTLGTFSVANTLQRDRLRAEELGRLLVAEINQCLYMDPADQGVLGPETGENARGVYNDVDDYNGLVDSPPRDKSGSPLTGYGGNWKRSVVVEWVDPTDWTTVKSTDSGMKRITVTVTDPRGRQTVVRSLRSKYGAFEAKANVTTTYTSWVGVTLQVGPDANGRVSGGANTLSQIP